MNIDKATNAQLQNWDNFCRYHLGDWHGDWTKYSSSGRVVESFKCVRSFSTNVDRSEITHRNYYIYADDKTETQTFGPYKKPSTRSLFLDNSFSWGSTEVKTNYPFGFETGFRYENRRSSIAIVYPNSTEIDQIVTIAEHDASFSEKSSPKLAFQFNETCPGTFKSITPDWIVSPVIETSYRQLEALSEDSHILHFPKGLSVSCPRQLENKKEFFLAVDWQVNDTLLLRGIRYFSASVFKKFALETFRYVS